jgi:hypothetical protein
MNKNKKVSKERNLFYDFDTDNDSFIEVCEQYKEKGIKKWYFPLLLYDKDLVGVDPFDEENLSLKMKLKIKKEIRINVWYFLRQIVRIPEAGGVTRYKANRGNIALTFCMVNNIDSIEILPRQNGKTIGAISVYEWIYHYATINTNSVFSNKQLADSQLNIKRFNDIKDLFPDYLKSHLDEKEDTDNLGEIRCASNNNVITALSTPRDIASADKLGRGNTTATPWLSIAHFYSNVNLNFF